MVAPFLNFTGRCGEAIEFYEQVFGGQHKKVLRFGDLPPNPDQPVPEAMKDHVLHGEMEIRGELFWFGDTTEEMHAGEMITIAVSYPTVEEVRAVFAQLLEGGEVLIPLAEQFFSPLHGAVRDRFGVGWQIICRED